MSNLNETIRSKQQTNLEDAKRWLRRAQMDFNGFKRFVPFDKKSRKPVRCSDPALAVYLLQQSIEKATKAVAAATGKYSYRRLKSQGHNSLKLLLNFYRDILKTILKRPELDALGAGLGLDNEGLNKIINLMMEVEKTNKNRKAGETLYVEQFARATNAQISQILSLLLSFRGSGFLGVSKSVFGPHSKIVIAREKIDTSTPANLVSSTLEELRKQLNLSQLPEGTSELLENAVKLWTSGGITEEGSEEKIVIERPTKELLGQWSLVALLILAMYTFPHESTARYPGDRIGKEMPAPFGYEDYNEKLGIVSQLGQMGYVTMLALNELEPELEAIAAFYPVYEAKFK
jgi:hypothetical protein